MTDNNTFFNQYNTNPNLTGNIITLGHLRIYLNLKYPSLRKAGEIAELSHSRMKQIVTAKYLPQSPEIIYRIAKAWSIDPVKLTQLFEKYRGVRR